MKYPPITDGWIAMEGRHIFPTTCKVQRLTSGKFRAIARMDWNGAAYRAIGNRDYTTPQKAWRVALRLAENLARLTVAQADLAITSRVVQVGHFATSTANWKDTISKQGGAK